MEDFEYSVEISDRDWECFFAECEECNLLPPSLAGVDDSGMSDIDGTGSILAKRVQKVDLTAEADSPIDDPPDCEGSPVEHYLCKHAVGGMVSVLSGSEEDIHLQSVNMFFERLKNLTEAEGLTEPNHVRDGKNREVIHKDEEGCGDGKRASSSCLPKNSPELSSPPANGEAAVGKETAEPVDTISYINTMKKDALGANISPEPAASNLVLKTNKSPCPETRLFIREEACTETRVNEATRPDQSHDSPEGVVYSETAPHADRVITQETCTPLDDVKQEDFLTSQLTVSRKCSTDSSSNHEMVTHVKRKEIHNSDFLSSTRTNKTAGQEWSPSASVKRKRRKKRRLSVEQAESVHGYERQVLVKQSDSEEEKYSRRGGTGVCLSEDCHLSSLHKAQKDIMSTLITYSATSNLPVKLSAEEIKVNCLPHCSPPCYHRYQYLPESKVRKCKETGSAESNATNDSSVNSLSQNDDIVVSAPNNSGNVATHLQPCSKLHEEESPGLPVSITDCVTGKSDLATETPICGRNDSHTGLQQSDKMNTSIGCCEDEQNSEACVAEVKSISILPSAKSNDPSVEVCQYDELSAAKSVLAVEAGDSGRDDHTLCQRAAEPQQQLEVDCQDTDQYRSTLEKDHIPLSASASDAHNAKPKQFKTRASPVLEEVFSQVGCAKDISNVLKRCLAKSPSSEYVNITAQQTEHPLVPLTFSAKNTIDGGTELSAAQIKAFQSGDPLQSHETNLTDKSQRGTESSLTSPSDITPVSSCCTLDPESVMSLSNENITSSCLSISHNNTGDQGEKASLIPAEHEEGNGTSEYKCQSASNSKCDLAFKEEEEIITASKAECEPEKAPGSEHPVFAMSSFWIEMEKLTINDILGVRMIREAAPSSSLPLLPESNGTNMFAVTDSGFFTQLDNSKPEQTHEDMPSHPNSVESSSGSSIAVDSSPSRDVMWESIEADIYPGNMMLTPQPVLPEGDQKCLGNISKNVSVHNLHALESESLRYKMKGQSLQTLDEDELHKVEHFTDGHMPKQDTDVDSYRISLSDIFQYLFRGKQSIPSQPTTDDITACYAGNSVPESYDHFFSEFDTESFFYPLIKAEDQTKDELVPNVSFSRSASRNLQIPEAYDHFFPSSSSDESSVESDDEDNHGPVRVVTRFSQTSSPSQISTDMYENFFTDSDLGQNFFWKTILSFRNISLTGYTVQRRTPSNPLSPVPVRLSGRSFGSTVHPRSALRNQDVMFQQPFRYEDSQVAISNPRLDASLLPLRQPEMCLVCIAFASWVLKTANPQVEDTWKAVLLANVSALSAIRYLRKYVRMEAAAGGKKLNDTAPCDS